MTDRHRSFIAIGSVALLCALALAFLVPGSSGHPGTKHHQTTKLSLSTPNTSTTTSTTSSTTPSTTSVTPSTAGTPTSGASAPASGSRGSQGGNAVAPLGGGTGGTGGSTGSGTATTNPPAPTTSTTPTTAAPAPPPASGCGGQPDIGPASGQQWTCTFDSEFTGTTLDTSKWLVMQTSNSGFTDGDDCYENSPNNVSVGGGVLTLTVRQEAAPFTCTKPLGSFTTSYTAGEVTTYEKWSQEFGLFEVRAKLPSATVPGLLDTLWLYPAEEHLYGGGGASGEIDFAEWWSQYPSWDIPVVHYNNSLGDPDSTTHCDVAPGQFNDYGVEWTPSTITILLNGAACLTDNWDPLLPQTKPEPFNQGFTINLTQALATSFSPGSTPLPASMEVQWVHVWSLPTG